MSSVVDKVGQVVSSQVLQAPERARFILEAAYTYVNVTSRFKRKATVSQTVDRYNGTIASTIVRALRHPEDSVLVNIFMPCEFFQAMGLTPMFPEGIAVYVACTACSDIFAEQAEALGVPESLCSYHKTMLGMVETGVIPKPLMVANTTLACDANQVSFRRVAQLCDVPHRVIDVPFCQDEDAVAYVADQLRSLVSQLEDLTHRKLDEEALQRSLALSESTLLAMDRFARDRGQATLPMTATGELCNFIATHCMLGTPETAEYVQNMLALEQAAFGKASRNPRIFWIHTLPNWQASMRDIFDDAAQCELVGCDLTLDDLHKLDLFDPAKPYETLARRVVYNSNNGGGSRRIEAALDAARKAKADGAVVFCHWGCKQTMGISHLAKQVFEEAGIPTLVLDGDGCDPRNVSDGQMVTRLNAFIEQLKAR